MSTESIHQTQFCPHYQAAIELIGRRWTGAIVRAMLAGICRFGELRDAIPDLSEKMLSERLKELESEAIVRRVIHPETPVRIEYHLTSKGESLGQIVDVIGAWAHRWIEPGGEETKTEK